MLLEKVSMHTAILFVHCCKFLLLLLVLFLCFVENCTLLPKGINEFVVFLCIVHLCFRLFTLLPRFLLLVIKGQFFPRTNKCIFFQLQKCSNETYKKSKIHPIPLMIMQRHEMWYTYTQCMFVINNPKGTHSWLFS
jgi:hypothetical protein